MQIILKTGAFTNRPVSLIYPGIDSILQLCPVTILSYFKTKNTPDYQFMTEYKGKIKKGGQGGVRGELAILTTKREL